MKWSVLALMMVAALAAPSWLRGKPRRLAAAGFLIGFCPFFLSTHIGGAHAVMAPISWAEWSGYVKGMEVSVVDFLALAVYLSAPRKRPRLPFKFAMGAYFAAVALSVLQSDVPMASLLYLWQLLRLYFLYVVLARACQDSQFSTAVMKGLGAAVIVEAFVTISQRFLFHVVEAYGTFPGHNGVGMATNLVVLPFFAVLLSTRTGRLPWAVILLGVVVELATASRATLGLGALGFGLLFVVSCAREWTSRKASILAIGAVLAATGGVAASVALHERFVAQVVSDYDERAAFEKAAGRMLEDHPFGVGANEYVMVANTQGYNAQAGVAAVSSSRSANVHNVYRLVAAETGYLGLITFVLLQARCASFFFLAARRHKYDQRADLLLGVGVSFFILYLHQLYEWVSITLEMQTIYVVLLAMAVGVSNQLLATPPSQKPHGVRLTHRGRDRQAAENLVVASAVPEQAARGTSGEHHVPFPPFDDEHGNELRTGRRALIQPSLKEF